MHPFQTTVFHSNAIEPGIKQIQQMHMNASIKNSAHVKQSIKKQTQTSQRVIVRRYKYVYVYVY